jgi:hypothetical protein
MITQPDLFTPAAQAAAETKVSDAEKVDFRARLISSGAWQTRAQICATLGWPERKVRAVAESLGAEVVRSQHGFKLFDNLTDADVSLARESAAFFHSQSVKMEDYFKALSHRLATRIG